MSKSALKIGGFVPLSTTDYPKNLAAVVFCQGCPWRCRYCHNISLISSKTPGSHDWEIIYNFLKRRRNLLDAVVFSGGEPSLQKILLDAMKQTKDLGFKIGIHTGGMYPDKLAILLPYIDWIGLDIKTDFNNYSDITCVKNSGKYILDSLNLILEAKTIFECRTTIHKKLHNTRDLIKLGTSLAKKGVLNYALQTCRTIDVLDKSLIQNFIPTTMKNELCNSFNKIFINFTFRD